MGTSKKERDELALTERRDFLDKALTYVGYAFVGGYYHWDSYQMDTFEQIMFKINILNEMLDEEIKEEEQEE